jgi:hypothetical protein
MLADRGTLPSLDLFNLAAMDNSPESFTFTVGKLGLPSNSMFYDRLLTQMIQMQEWLYVSLWTHTRLIMTFSV